MIPGSPAFEPPLERDLVKDCALFYLPIIEDLDAAWVQRLTAVEDEAVMLPKKCHLTTAFGAALRLVFRALIEVAKATEVFVSRVKEKDVDLMVSDSCLPLVPEST